MSGKDALEKLYENIDLQEGFFYEELGKDSVYQLENVTNFIQLVSS